eukprot:3869948-Prymnesium_polylepis.1
MTSAVCRPRACLSRAAGRPGPDAQILKISEAHGTATSETLHRAQMVRRPSWAASPADSRLCRSQALDRADCWMRFLLSAQPTRLQTRAVDEKSSHEK